MTIKSNKKGVCPFCNQENLDYDCINNEGNMCYYEWHCNSCGQEGEEWYALKFIGHNVYDEKGNIIQLYNIKKKG